MSWIRNTGLKGQCHEICCFWFFHESAGFNDTGSKFATGINDTGCKFATSFASVVDGNLPPVSTTLAAILPPVSMTLVANNGNNIRLLRP
jgi:hypothetical protein